MRTLQDWERDLEQLSPPSSIELGLDRVRIVFDRLPIVRPKHIYIISGTNGKGSTVETLAALTTAAGLKTCQYTSPHIKCINERFKVDRQEIRDEDLIEAFEVVRRRQADTFLTYFEFLTMSAFYAFSLMNSDVWILEIGLGGRLDAVNVIDPDVSIITPIALDHEEYLGDTIEKIGLEKAGIMRAGRPVLTAAETVRSTLILESERLGSEIKWLSDCMEGSVVKIAAHSLDLSACKLPQSSVGLALMAYLERDLELPNQTQQLINSIRMPGRLSPAWYSKHSITLDVGHNLGALEYVTGQMSLQINRADRVVIFGALNDKDVAGCSYI